MGIETEANWAEVERGRGQPDYIDKADNYNDSNRGDQSASYRDPRGQQRNNDQANCQSGSRRAYNRDRRGS